MVSSEYCNFSVYMIGDLKDIRKVDKIFENGCYYDYNLKSEIGKKLNIFDNPNNILYDFLNLAIARKEAEDAGNKKAIEALKDENLKKEMFVNIPGNHFYAIEEYFQDEKPAPVTDYGEVFKNTPADYYVSKSYGKCGWGINQCISGIGGSPYHYLSTYFPDSIFRGVTLGMVSEMFPTMRLCVVGKNPGIENSEMVIMHNRFTLFNGSASIYPKVGNDNTIAYTSFAPWYKAIDNTICPNEDFIFDILGRVENEKM